LFVETVAIGFLLVLGLGLRLLFTLLLLALAVAIGESTAMLMLLRRVFIGTHAKSATLGYTASERAMSSVLRATPNTVSLLMAAGSLLKKALHHKKTQQSPVAIGAVLGGLSAASKGKDSLEKLANTILGALAGMVLGSIVSALVEALSSIEREVIYEAT
jgi:uncharacterized protein YcfJ